MLGNYAQFLLGECGDHLAAEAMFKRALAARDNHVNNLVAYGQFLAEHRKVTAFHSFSSAFLGFSLIVLCRTFLAPMTSSSARLQLTAWMVA